MMERCRFNALETPDFLSQNYRVQPLRGFARTGMYGDRLADAAKVMRGEADELAARDDMDDHLTDVIEGLRHHASEVEEFLQEEYYR